MTSFVGGVAELDDGVLELGAGLAAARPRASSSWSGLRMPALDEDVGEVAAGFGHGQSLREVDASMMTDVNQHARTVTFHDTRGSDGVQVKLGIWWWCLESAEPLADQSNRSSQLGERRAGGDLPTGVVF